MYLIRVTVFLWLKIALHGKISSFSVELNESFCFWCIPKTFPNTLIVVLYFFFLFIFHKAVFFQTTSALFYSLHCLSQAKTTSLSALLQWNISDFLNNQENWWGVTLSLLQLFQNIQSFFFLLVHFTKQMERLLFNVSHGKICKNNSKIAERTGTQIQLYTYFCLFVCLASFIHLFLLAIGYQVIGIYF